MAYLSALSTQLSLAWGSAPLLSRNKTAMRAVSSKSRKTPSDLLEEKHLDEADAAGLTFAAYLRGVLARRDRFD